MTGFSPDCDNPEKNPPIKGENQLQTQPTCNAGSGNRTRDTLVGGECAIPAHPRSDYSRIYTPAGVYD